MTTIYKERLRWKADVLIVHSVENFVRRFQLELKNGDDSILLDISKEQYDPIAAVINNSQFNKQTYFEKLEKNGFKQLLFTER